MPPDELITSALRHLGHITVTLTPLEGYLYIYDRHEQHLYVDSRCDNPLAVIRRAVVDQLKVTREFAVIPGDRTNSTACGYVPEQRADEDVTQPIRLPLRVVRN